jgi:hypothetical protein
MTKKRIILFLILSASLTSCFGPERLYYKYENQKTTMIEVSNAFEGFRRLGIYSFHGKKSWRNVYEHKDRIFLIGYKCSINEPHYNWVFMVEGYDENRKPYTGYLYAVTDTIGGFSQYGRQITPLVKGLKIIPLTEEEKNLLQIAQLKKEKKEYDSRFKNDLRMIIGWVSQDSVAKWW